MPEEPLLGPDVCLPTKSGLLTSPTSPSHRAAMVARAHDRSHRLQRKLRRILIDHLGVSPEMIEARSISSGLLGALIELLYENTEADEIILRFPAPLHELEVHIEGIADT